MKILRIISTALLITLLAATSVFAQTAPQISSSVVHFRIKILGTRHYADINVIRDNLRKSPKIKDFAPSAESQLHIEFKGIYYGSVDDLLADIRSLSANRYDVESRSDRRHGLIITLRKIQYAPPPTTAAPAPQVSELNDDL